MWAWLRFSGSGQVLRLMLCSLTAFGPATHPNVESFGLKGTTRWPWSQSLGFKTGICSGWWLSAQLYLQVTIQIFGMSRHLCPDLLKISSHWKVFFPALSLLPWAGLSYNDKKLWYSCGCARWTQHVQFKMCGQKFLIEREAKNGTDKKLDEDKLCQFSLSLWKWFPVSNGFLSTRTWETNQSSSTVRPASEVDITVQEGWQDKMCMLITETDFTHL